MPKAVDRPSLIRAVGDLFTQIQRTFPNTEVTVAFRWKDDGAPSEQFVASTEATPDGISSLLRELAQSADESVADGTAKFTADGKMDVT